MSKVNLAIIGGGLVGASLALALQAGARERGWSIVLIEPFAPGNAYQPSYDARSSALSYGSRQIYERLGLWPAIAERAEPILHIHVSDRGRFGATRLTAIEEGVPALGYVVENAWLGQCLWKALDPEVVRWHCPAEVKTLEAREGGYRLTLDDETQLDCELAILADGGRSGLREQLGIAVEQTPYRQTALIANVSPSEAHLGQAFERFTPSGPMALLPLPDNRCALIWTRPGKDAERLRGLDDAAFLGGCRLPSATASAPSARSAHGTATPCTWSRPASRCVRTWWCWATLRTVCTPSPARASTCRCATPWRWSTPCSTTTRRWASSPCCSATSMGSAWTSR